MLLTNELTLPVATTCLFSFSISTEEKAMLLPIFSYEIFTSMDSPALAARNSCVLRFTDTPGRTFLSSANNPAVLSSSKTARAALAVMIFCFFPFLRQTDSGTVYLRYRLR